MFDTLITVVGNALTEPELRQTTKTQALVASFKVASTARRLNKETGDWVDGNSLRVRVTCWRRLAENVTSCVRTGDPLIVVGRLYTRDWTDDEGNQRVAYEVDAVAVGHDLSKGTSRFARQKAVLRTTSMVEDPQAEARAGGEPTVPVPVPPPPADPPAAPVNGEDWLHRSYAPIGALHEGGLEAAPLDEPSFGDPPLGVLADIGQFTAAGADPASAEPEGDEPGEPDPVEPDDDNGSGEPGTGGRRRPRRGRVPVPA